MKKAKTIKSTRGAVVTRPMYGEGDIFAIPLENLGWGFGVIARGKRKPRGETTLFIYTFESTEPRQPTRCSFSPRARDAVAYLLTSSMGLSKGTWKVVGRVEPYVRKDWLLPRFLSCIGGYEPHWVQYDEDNLDKQPMLIRYVNENRVRGPIDSLSGYIAAQYHAENAIKATQAGECRRGEYGWHIPGQTKE